MFLYNNNVYYLNANYEGFITKEKKKSFKDNKSSNCLDRNWCYDKT
jgi:hypothetical protein